MDITYTQPRPVYQIAYSGELTAGSWGGTANSFVEIPYLHSREGDREKNHALFYVISASNSATYSGTWGAPAAIAIIGKDNVVGVMIYAAMPFPYLHHAGGLPLRIAAINSGITYHVTAYYENPDGR